MNENGGDIINWNKNSFRENADKKLWQKQRLQADNFICNFFYTNDVAFKFVYRKSSPDLLLFDVNNSKVKVY